MRRLCAESSCSYSGKSVPRAGRAAMEVELRAIPKGMDSPSNPNAAEVATGAGLRAAAKAAETPPAPKATRSARSAATRIVMGQKSAAAILAAQRGKAKR
jgi:hypothetical protein